jgi:tellurite resistance protein TehA-like permease
LILFALGIWGAIVPFVGPYFHYAYVNHHTFSFPTYGRLWLAILPGALAALAGIELMRSANRTTAVLAAVCAVVAGAWFVVGPAVSTLWNHGVSQSGRPLGGTDLRAVEQLGYFYALGAAIMFVGAFALGRVLTRSVRDARWAEHRAVDAPAPPVAA